MGTNLSFVAPRRVTSDCFLTRLGTAFGGFGFGFEEPDALTSDMVSYSSEGVSFWLIGAAAVRPQAAPGTRSSVGTGHREFRPRVPGKTRSD